MINNRNWKTELENETNYNKRTLIVLDHLDEMGMDTSNYPERIKAEKELANADV